MNITTDLFVHRFDDSRRHDARLLVQAISWFVKSEAEIRWLCERVFTSEQALDQFLVVRSSGRAAVRQYLLSFLPAKREAHVELPEPNLWKLRLIKYLGIYVP